MSLRVLKHDALDQMRDRVEFDRCHIASEPGGFEGNSATPSKHVEYFWRCTVVGLKYLLTRLTDRRLRTAPFTK
jgi:hypothetical protein